MKQAAYDVQKQPWSKADVPNRDLRLSQAKMLSATPVVGDLAESARLTRASTGAEPLVVTGASVAPPCSPVVIRSLAVAALAILGEAGDAAVLVEGVFRYRPALRWFEALDVARSTYVDDYRLCIDGACRPMSAWIPVSAGSTRLFACG